MSYARLHIIAEGQSEEGFVKNTLCSHLCAHNVFTDARKVLTSKDKKKGTQHKGGIPNYAKAKNDITQWVKEDRKSDCFFTTMFDLYALPNDFPGYTQAQQSNDPYEKVAVLEDALAKDINDTRFIPYIQLHEFEALLFTDLSKLESEYLEDGTKISTLIASVKGYENPELINDGSATAPSKRILTHLSSYDKATVGPLVIKKIGIPKLVETCRHFGEWIAKLEGLAQ